ncbi:MULTISPECIES: TIGR00725 family protein [unclassified Frankia]
MRRDGRMRRDEVYIGVIGPAKATVREVATAESVGRRLAEVGWYVVCGGLGGIMAAACRGARSVGGTTIGLLPGLSRDEGNDHLTVSLPTGLGELRNGLLVRGSDALVAVGGSWGTLSEISFALRAGKTVIGLDTWAVDAQDSSLPTVIPVQDVDDVVPLLRAHLNDAGPRRGLPLDDVYRFLSTPTAAIRRSDRIKNPPFSLWSSEALGAKESLFRS